MQPGAILRHVRRMTGSSQRELAKRASLPRSVLGRVESAVNQPTPFTRALDAARYELVAIPTCPAPSSELMAHLRSVPLDERVEMALQARGADDLASLI